MDSVGQCAGVKSSLCTLCLLFIMFIDVPGSRLWLQECCSAAHCRSPGASSPMLQIITLCPPGGSAQGSCSLGTCWAPLRQERNYNSLRRWNVTEKYNLQREGLVKLGLWACPLGCGEGVAKQVL